MLYQTKGGRMENKFNLIREQNVFVAKRNIVDYIWKSANLEGIGVIYSETQAIYDGVFYMVLK